MISPEANNFETNNLIIYHIITAFILIYKLKKCSAALSEHFKWASACRFESPSDYCGLKSYQFQGFPDDKTIS